MILRQSQLEALNVELRQHLGLHEERTDPICQKVGTDVVSRAESISDGTQNEPVGKQGRPCPSQNTREEIVRNEEAYPGDKANHVREHHNKVETFVARLGGSQNLIK
jgi:hypothetical protein